MSAVNKQLPLSTIKKIAIAACLTIVPALPSQAATLSLTSGLDYSTGKYGGTNSTDVTYIPVTAKYATSNWLLKLTVPYISITGPANTTPNIGQAVYRSNALRTDSGLGDVITTASYNLVDQDENGLLVDLTGKIKFGTADKYLGLGTGANDYAAESNIYKLYGRKTIFGSVGYKVFGQSLGYTLNNAWYGSAGFSYGISNQANAGLIYDYRNQTSSLSDPQKMWTMFYSKKISPSWKTQTYLFKGAGNTSPDYGGGLMFTRQF